MPIMWISVVSSPLLSDTAATRVAFEYEVRCPRTTTTHMCSRNSRVYLLQHMGLQPAVTQSEDLVTFSDRTSFV